MHTMRPQRGRMTDNYKCPDWGPLVAIAPQHVGDFMWMFEVELENGVKLHAYKHWETRSYLHLDHGQRAYVYIWDESRAEGDDGRYEQVDPGWLLALVLDRSRRAALLRREALSEFNRLRWARSASRYRIPRRSTRFVIARCRLRFTESPPAEAPGDESERLVFLGDDERGRALEVMGIQREDESLMVIHAMELRDRYRVDYEEARRWQA